MENHRVSWSSRGVQDAHANGGASSGASDTVGSVDMLTARLLLPQDFPQFSNNYLNRRCVQLGDSRGG